MKLLPGKYFWSEERKKKKGNWKAQLVGILYPCSVLEILELRVSTERPTCNGPTVRQWNENSGVRVSEWLTTNVLRSGAEQLWHAPLNA